MNLETYMKRCLDGNFWRVDYEGKVHHVTVPLDYMPSFNRNCAPVNNNPDIQPHRIHWTEQHFHQIQRYRMRGVSWLLIARKLSTSETAVTDYYKKCIRRQNEKMSDEILSLRISQVKEMAESFIKPDRIASLMCYPISFIESVLGGRDYETRHNTTNREGDI